MLKISCEAALELRISCLSVFIDLPSLMSASPPYSRQQAPETSPTVGTEQIADHLLVQVISCSFSAHCFPLVWAHIATKAGSQGPKPRCEPHIIFWLGEGKEPGQGQLETRYQVRNRPGVFQTLLRLPNNIPQKIILLLLAVILQLLSPL